MIADYVLNSILEIIFEVIKYLWNAFLATGMQIFIILGPALILASVMNLVASAVEKSAYKVFGLKIYLYTFGWLGTAVHEIGHAIFCIIFRHKITEMKLFSIDTENKTLGHVNHSYNPNSFYQQVGKFFIGIGPIILGTITIYYLSKYLLGPHIFVSSGTSMIDYNSFTSFNSLLLFFENIFNSGIEILSHIFSLNNFSDWKFYLFLYLAFSIGSSITLSRPDIEGALEGFGVMFTALLLLNIATLWVSGFVTKFFVDTSRLYTSIYPVMIFVILLNVFVSIILLIVSKSVSTVKTNIQSAAKRRK